VTDFKVIGLMSGTSLDGLDIACCAFIQKNDRWEYTILKAETLNYSEEQKNIFHKMYIAGGQELIALDHAYGQFLGKAAKKFLERHHLQVDFISSHGHTVFHRPDKGYTFQAGNGADITAVTGLPVVCDFRTLDVAMGGQGAPLVPVGDKLLFPEYDLCLNLGGIANISFENDHKRLAYDICPVNIVLNELAARLGRAYDAEGCMAKSGKMIEPLFGHFQQLPYYYQKYPKSIGKDWVDEFIFPLLPSEVNTRDQLYTFCHHVSSQITRAINEFSVKGTDVKKILVTGGGAFNSFLLELLKSQSPENMLYVIPDKNMVMFKEALIFAFLGVLRVKNQYNALAAVTGAKADTIGGALYGNFSGLLQ
jgi:anhydro-N-acetylmuramic acid kinase